MDRIRRYGADLNVHMKAYSIPPMARARSINSRLTQQVLEEGSNLRIFALARLYEIPPIASESKAALPERDAILTSIISQSDADLDSGDEKSCRTPLIEAIRANNLNMMEYLLNHGASPNMCCQHGISPLMYATTLGDDASVFILTQRGADVGSHE